MDIKAGKAQEPMFGYIENTLSEIDAVNLITGLKSKLNSTPDLAFFYNLLLDPVGYEGLEEYEGFYLGTNIPREEFGLKRNGLYIVPGDFDILIIPYNNNKLFYDRTAVIEVKIARPSIKKVNKSSKSLGTDQIKGLIKDGFPLIGLLHICMTKPLEEKHAAKVKLYNYPIGDGAPQSPKGPMHEDDFSLINHDWLPSLAIKNQMQRMITSGLPKFIGIDAFAINLNKDGEYVITSSSEYRGYQSAYFNPKKDKITLKRIEEHFNNYRFRYRKIEIKKAASKVL